MRCGLYFFTDDEISLMSYEESSLQFLKDRGWLPLALSRHGEPGISCTNRMLAYSHHGPIFSLIFFEFAETFFEF